MKNNGDLSFLKHGREESRRARGRRARAEWTRAQRGSSRGPSVQPDGEPLSRAAHGFSPTARGRGGGSVVKQVIKRAKSLNRFLCLVTPFTRALHAPCSVSCVMTVTKRRPVQLWGRWTGSICASDFVRKSKWKVLALAQRRSGPSGN